jgi:hypothetical protein
MNIEEKSMVSRKVIILSLLRQRFSNIHGTFKFKVIAAPPVWTDPNPLQRPLSTECFYFVCSSLQSFNRGPRSTANIVHAHSRVMSPHRK